VTNDAYIKRDLTPLSTKVIGLVREVKVNDYQHVGKGDERCQPHQPRVTLRPLTFNTG
jgi:hypothetical protein